LFSIDPSMKTISFSATIKADDWEATARQFLKEFSRVEVWTDNLQTSRVWVMSSQGSQSDDRNVDIRLSLGPNTKCAEKTSLLCNTCTNSSIEDLLPHIRNDPTFIGSLQSIGILVPQS
jgi:hypothetical protein